MFAKWIALINSFFYHMQILHVDANIILYFKVPI